jgi:phospholipase/carboxylesterase
MNRIELPTEIVSSLPTYSSSGLSYPSPSVPRGRVLGPEATPYATFSPIHYEDGYAYPLVVWLHGAAGNEQQLRRVIPSVSMRNYVAIAPRGTFANRSRRSSFGWRQSDDAIEEAAARVFDCLAIASGRFHVHPRRIFLAGVGCGGTMAVRLAWNYPDKFAGAATFGGPLPTHGQPLRHVNALRRLPCFLATGRRSREYPEADVCRDLRLLHAAGCTVALRQYPCGDELTTAMLSDLNHWIMELVCGE